MLTRIIAINKTLLSVYFLADRYYVVLEDVKVYSKRNEILKLPQVRRNGVTFIEWDAFTKFLFSIKCPSFLEQETIDAIKDQWNFILEEEKEEKIKSDQSKKDDYFIKY